MSPSRTPPGLGKGEPPTCLSLSHFPLPNHFRGGISGVDPPTSLSREVPMRIGGTWWRSDVAVAEQQTFSTGIGMISPLCVPTSFWSSKKNNFPAFHKFLMGSKTHVPGGFAPARDARRRGKPRWRWRGLRSPSSLIILGHFWGF